MKSQEVTEIVKQNSCLKILGRRCVDCGVAKTCYTRTEFTETKLGKRNNWQCDSCQIALQKQKEQEYLEYCLEQERIKQQHKQVLINKMGEYRNFQLRHIPSVSEIDVLTKLLLVLITERLTLY